MSTIVTRAGKGSPLTHNEVDANFNNLNTDKAEVGSANTFTAAQTISNQLNLTKATDYNLYASGAGANYMAGALGIGNLPVAATTLTVGKNITGATGAYGTFGSGAIQSDVTVLGCNFLSALSTQATTFTLTNLRNFDSASVTLGASSSVTTQVGFYSRALTGATNNYSFQGLTAAATGRYNLYMSGTADNYLAGSLTIGTAPSAAIGLYIGKTITGATTAYASAFNGSVQSDVTSLAYGVYSGISTAAAAFTLTTLRQFAANGATIGAGSAVTTQAGFHVASTLTTATNNYAFQSDLAAGTSRYNLYMVGTADNYLAGGLGIGGLPTTGINLRIAGNSTGITTIYGIQQSQAIQSDVTVAAYLNHTAVTTQAASFTLSSLYHYSAAQGTIGATSAVTSQYGYIANSSLTGATNNYGFFGNIAAATGRYNLYMSGTANNYLAGSLGIGAVGLTQYGIRLSKNITGNAVSYGMRADSTVQSDVTNAAYFGTAISTQATAFTLSALYHYFASQSTVGAGSAITAQSGFHVDTTLIGATNNYGFYGNIAAGTGRFNLYMAGTAANYFGGDMQFNKTVTAAGTTGAQTISKNAGTVNFAAAATSLVVTNTLVTTSSIIICTVGTNDTTMKSVSAVAAAGSFTIFSNAAATAETRVNFIVIN